MRGVFQKIFSRSTFVLLCIFALFLVDFLLVVGSGYLLWLLLDWLFPSASSFVEWILVGLSYLAVVVTVLNIVSRDMIPEAKIPWLLCVVGLQFFGVIIYAVFSHRRPSRSQEKLYGEIMKQSNEGESGTASPEDMEEWAQTGHALLQEGGFAVYGNTKTNFYPTGERFFEAFKRDLKSARSFIFLEYFQIEGGKMWDEILAILQERAKAGVEIRMLYDDIGSMGKVPARYDKRLQKAGIDCRKFNPFVPIVSNVHNNRDHRKIAVIDGKIAYTGGINLTDEYINEVQPFGVWKDSAVRLEGAGVRAFTLMFLQLYCLTAKRTEDFSQYLSAPLEEATADGFVQPYADGPKPMYETSIGENVYLNLINGAKKSVYITTPYLIIDYRLKEALLRASKRGVDVRLITPRIPDKKVTFSLTRSNYLSLIKGGVKIYEFTLGFMHAKQWVVDGEIGVVGTINLDYRSLLHHFEDAVVLYRCTAVEEMTADFEDLFQTCSLQTEKDAKKGVFSRAICHVIRAFAPLF